MNEVSKKYNELASFFIFNPVRSWVVCILFLLLGVGAVKNLTLRQYPKVPSRDILVEVNHSGSSSNVMDGIAKLAEKELLGCQGLNQMTTEVLHGKCRFWLTFDELTPNSDCMISVQQRMSIVMADLPRTLRPPIIRAISRADEQMATIAIAITGRDETLHELANITEQYCKPLIESIAGVANAFVQGAASSDDGQEVHLIPSALLQYNVSADACFRAIEAAECRESAGEIALGPVSMSVAAAHILETSRSLASIIVKYDSEKGYITLGDVAKIQHSDSTKSFKLRYQGKTSAQLLIYTKGDADLLAIGKKVKEQLEKFKEIVPNPNINVDIYYDQTHAMEESIKRVYHSLIDAIILVAIVIALTLGSIKATIAVLIPIPICLAGGLFIIWICGYTLNLLSLAAAVLSVGLIVDDPILVVEAIERRMRENNETPLKAALHVMHEIILSLVGMTMTLASAYLAIGFMTGMTGQMFKEFAIPLAGAIIISGIIAFVLTPLLAIWALSGHEHGEAVAISFRSNPFQSLFALLSGLTLKGFDYIEKLYIRSLRFVLKQRLTCFIAICAFCSVSTLIPRYNLSWIMAPDEDQASVEIQIQMPDRADARYVDQLIIQIENRLQQEAHVTSVSSSISTGERLKFSVNLTPPHKRHQTAKEIADYISKHLLTDLAKERHMTTATSHTPFKRGHSPTLIICSRNESDLYSKADEVIRALMTIGDFKGMYRTAESKAPIINIALDQEKAAKLGVSMHNATATVRHALAGNPPATYITVDGRKLPVAVMRDSEEISQAENVRRLKQTPVQTDRRREQGHGEHGLVALGDVADFYEGMTSAQKNRRTGLYYVEITVPSETMTGIDLYEYCAKIAKSVLPEKGFIIMPSEETENLYKERGNFAFVLSLAILCVYLFMAILFESWLQPFIIMFSVLPTGAGVCIGLMAIKGGSINIWSSLGLLTIIGLNTRIGIFLVTYFNLAIAKLKDKQKTESEIIEAAVDSARSRIRAVLMTFIIAFIDFLVTMLGKEIGYEAFQQMGASLIGGLVFGTLGTVYGLPIICVYFECRKLKSPENALTEA